MFNADEKLVQKWAPILEHESAPAIQDNYRKAVTARLLENQERAIRDEAAAMQGNFLSEAVPANAAGNVANFDPVLISLVRRAMPNLIAYDICGVQPMSGPTGLVFAMKSKYSTTRAGATGGTTEAFHTTEPLTGYSGNATSQDADPTGLVGVVDTTTPADGIVDEADTVSDLGTSLAGTGAGSPEDLAFSYPEMEFSIEKLTVSAGARALKAKYSMELAQDLKAIHGLDAEAELANILSTEILAEINREVVRTIYRKATFGAQQASITSPGVFSVDTDSDGRWLAEKLKGLAMQIEREANQIAKDTRRGKGNFVICSSDVASGLAAAGGLDFSASASAGLSVDDTGNTFVGTLNGRTRVYVDPYATGDFVVVGYRGSNPYDAGMFYCPYVPLTMHKTIGEEDFQPRIGFKTRYGMVANPFVTGANNAGVGTTGTDRSNVYFRIFRVDDLMASA